MVGSMGRVVQIENSGLFHWEVESNQSQGCTVSMQ